MNMVLIKIVSINQAMNRLKYMCIPEFYVGSYLSHDIFQMALCKYALLQKQSNYAYAYGIWYN